MQVATIVPQNYLKYIENDDYFMCLGNLIDSPGMERYTEFYRRKAAEGKFVIMDNGLIEGDPRPLPELVEKAYQLGASEMVMTDVFMDKERTLAAIDSGLTQLDPKHCPSLMLVAQGSSIDEWVSCAQQIIRNVHGFNYTIGVPKVLVKIGGRDARAAAIQQLLDVCPVARHCTFHLLGCWTTPLEVTLIDKLVRSNEKWPKIRGVDSAIPFVYARAGKKITHQDRPDSEPINFQETIVDESLLKYNINQWRIAADSTRMSLDPRRWF